VKVFFKITAWVAGTLLGILTLVVLWTYFFFRPMGKTPVELTVKDSSYQPVAHAMLSFVQSGERLFVPIPFSPSHHVERRFEERTDQNGHCRFYVRDQHCELVGVSVGGKRRRMLRYMDYRGEFSHSDDDPRPSWLLAAPPYEYKGVLIVE
jgi:hypothetical protein